MRRPNARSSKLNSDTSTTPNDNMYLSKPRTPSLSSSPKRRRSRFCILSLSIIAVLVLTYIAVTSWISISPKFGIVIDAGSTGTRIHVIGYRNGFGSVPVAIDLEITGSKKVSPGISAYVSSSESAGESLIDLIEFAKGIVPRDLWRETEVRLMATAGLRLVEPDVRERILDSCRKILRDSVFVFEDDWATVISGSDEGIYAWVAANYALGTLGGDPKHTSGIFELGGASAQVTFVTSETLPPEFAHVLKFGDITYNLYSHSFLHLGQNVAYESLNDLLISRDLKSSEKLMEQAMHGDPCTPRGFLHNTKSYSVGNFSQCRSAAIALLHKGKEKCLYRNCPLGSTFIPKLNGRFIATENFYYTSKFFRLGRSSVLSELILAGEKFCNSDWSKLKKKYRFIDDQELLLYCFSSAYIVALLHDTLGIALDDERIDFANNVEGVPLDWALGAFIMQEATNKRKSNFNWLADLIISYYDSLGMVPLILVPTIFVFTVWSLVKCRRKPQFKTIYDMEKGRYFITRIKR